MPGDPELGRALEVTHKHTRFRAWEMIVGRPIEYAASLIGESVSVSKMLEEIEAEDETSIASVEVIMALNRKWTGGEIFEAKDVAKFAHPRMTLQTLLCFGITSTRAPKVTPSAQ